LTASTNSTPCYRKNQELKAKGLTLVYTLYKSVVMILYVYIGDAICVGPAVPGSLDKKWRRRCHLLLGKRWNLLLLSNELGPGFFLLWRGTLLLSLMDGWGLVLPRRRVTVYRESCPHNTQGPLFMCQGGPLIDISQYRLLFGFFLQYTPLVPFELLDSAALL
jgi:hypothetical protein